MLLIAFAGQSAEATAQETGVAGANLRCDGGAALGTAGCSVEAYLLEILARDGVEPAMAALDGLVAVDADIRRDAHGFAHAIGINAYTGAEPVGEVFARCTPAYQSGCYHGVIQSYFLDHTRQNAGQLDGALVNDLCRQQREDPEQRWLHFQCAHGMGHGLVMLANRHLPTSLAGCDLVQDAWERESCYGGVFMENIVHETVPHHAVGRPDESHAGHAPPTEVTGSTTVAPEPAADHEHPVAAAGAADHQHVAAGDSQGAGQPEEPSAAVAGADIHAEHTSGGAGDVAAAVTDHSNHAPASAGTAGAAAADHSGHAASSAAVDSADPDAATSRAAAGGPDRDVVAAGAGAASAGGHADGDAGMSAAQRFAAASAAADAPPAVLDLTPPTSDFPGLKSDDPLYPCNVLDDRYLVACYQMQTSAVLFFNGYDIEAAAGTCTTAPEHMQPVCFQSLGRDVSSLVQQDHDEAMRLCATAPPQSEPWCHIGYAKNLIDLTADSSDGMEYCRLLPDGESKRVCHVAVGEQIWVLSESIERRAELCAAAAEGYVGQCRSGAGLPEETALVLPLRGRAGSLR